MDYIKELFAKIVSDKMNILVIILFIIAVFTIRNSYIVMKGYSSNGGTEVIENTITDNAVRIDGLNSMLEKNSRMLSDRTLLQKSQSQITRISENDLNILKMNNSTIQSLKSIYIANIILKSKKMNDIKGAEKDLDSLSKIIESNRYIDDYDNIVKEIQMNKNQLGLK